MTELYYKDALKLAQKEYKMCQARGQSPYLPVLNDILPSGRKESNGIELGLVQIPLEHIVGTKTAGRTNAFARNFMPMLAEGTEFADKWKALCRAHLEEGIRDPIKVYEYYNRYYVQEGNKRVSVLKFFNAVAVPAQVIRILPPRDGSEKSRLYYELVDFYRLSKVNFLEFTKPGSYIAFQKYIGKAPDDVWSDDERARLNTVYFYFGKAYNACGGQQLSSTVGDALLAYIRIYGYHSLQAKSAAEIKADVTRAWEEISLQEEPTPIDVKLDPGPEKKRPDLLTKALIAAERPKLKKVAFIHDRSPETSGWTLGHEMGREQVQRILDGRIVTRAYFREAAEDPARLIETAIAEGNTLIFTTSPVLLPASLRAAVQHPEVTIFNCSLNKPHRYVRTYYARMYEVKFIIGAIAGALAGDNDVGYICDYPIFGQIAGINAFALGVEMVNPRAKVYLEWSGIDSVEAAAARLTARGIRLISSQDLARLASGGRASFGLSLVNENGTQVNLARPVWNWGVYYESMIRGVLDRSLKSEYEESRKALNYYWGLSAGVVELHHDDKLPDGIHRLARMLQKSIRQGVCEPFRGPIYAQGGRMMRGAHESLSLGQIINMDWLVENIVGTIPEYSQLTAVGKATVDMVGVEKASEEAAIRKKKEESTL